MNCKKDVVERFLRYAMIDTQSAEESDTKPSTMKQHELAKLLADELKEMGADEITYDQENCYVYATVPATEGYENHRVLGLIAHMDTSPAMSDTNVKPRIVKAYDAKSICLNEELGIHLTPEEFPELLEYVGQDLIVTDGTTLLGADDKAGIAEIMSTAAYLLSHPKIGHGKIRVAFTPDEEVGGGTDHFNVELFGADVAYTVDGGALGELEYENFNAAGARLIVHGRSVHPGSAKGKMKNAILIAQEFQSLLPVFENPMYTEGYEGFYHLDGIRGNVEECLADYIIRDHSRELFESKKERFLANVSFLNEKYGEGTVEVRMKDSYYNMRNIIENGNLDLIELARQTMEELDIVPRIHPIRGGTDGARLTFMGLPCPNLCTGGENFHGKHEYISIQSMEKIVELLLSLVQKF